jgi:hypothetical protein
MAEAAEKSIHQEWRFGPRDVQPCNRQVLTEIAPTKDDFRQNNYS